MFNGPDITRSTQIRRLLAASVENRVKSYVLHKVFGSLGAEMNSASQGCEVAVIVASAVSIIL